MKLINYLFLLAISFSFSVDSVQPPSIDSFLQVTDLQGNLFTPDEKTILFQSSHTGNYCLYAMDLTTNQMRPITCENLIPMAYFPNEKRLVSIVPPNAPLMWGIQNAQGKIERTDLYPFPSPHIFTAFLGINEAGSKILFLSNAESEHIGVWEMDINTKVKRQLFVGEEGIDFWQIKFSKDFRYIAATKHFSKHDSELIVIDTKTKKQVIHNLPTHHTSYAPIAFSANNQHLYYITDDGSEYKHIRAYDFSTQTSRIVMQRAGEIDTAAISPDETHLVAFSNEESRHRLVIFNLKQNRVEALPDIPKGTSGGQMSITNDKVAFYLSVPTSGRNLYIYNWTNDDLKQLTHVLPPTLSPEQLVEAEHVYYPSRDGQMIPALYYKPIQTSTRPAPALIWAHGGPTGQNMHVFDERIQILLQHGYAVLAPNPRGSTGYGKTFTASADHHHGDLDLDDYLAGKKFLIATGEVDEKRIGIAGESYGGYITLAALAFRSEEFSVGIDFCGPSDWVLALKTIPVSFRFKKEHIYNQIGNPDSEEQYLQSISPLYFAENITKPLIIVQGGQDRATVPYHAEEMAWALKEQVPLAFLFFPEEGHAIVHKKNRKVIHESILNFLQKHLG